MQTRLFTINAVVLRAATRCGTFRHLGRIFQRSVPQVQTKSGRAVSEQRCAIAFTLVKPLHRGWSGGQVHTMAEQAGASSPKRRRTTSRAREDADEKWDNDVKTLGVKAAVKKYQQERSAWAAKPMTISFSVDESTEPLTATISHTVGNIDPPEPTCEGVPFDPSDRHHRLEREQRGAVTGGRIEIPTLPGAHIDFDIVLVPRRTSQPHVDADAITPCWLEIDRVMDLNHTFVPPSYRGQGVGVKLGRAAFAYAVQEGLWVRPTCSYIRDAFVPRAPDLADQLEWAATDSGKARAVAAAKLVGLSEDALRKLCSSRGVEIPPGGKLGMIHALLESDAGDTKGRL